MSTVLSGIHVYPVKSLRGHSRTTARAGERGFAGDRRWMLVDPEGGFLTQRSHPHLTLLAAAETGAGGLVLSVPGVPASGSIEVPPPGRGERITVRVWSSQLQAITAPAAVDAWLSDHLGTPCRLVYQPDAAVRPVAPPWAGDGEHVSLADGFPYLLTSEESLADLNDRMARPVGMDRFRPNLVLRGGAAWAEDGWYRLRVGAVIFRVTKPCTRCRVTTVDPETGETGPEPLRTLATFRRRADGVAFGVNLVAETTGQLDVGAPVAALA